MNETKIRILQTAQKNIESGMEEYICYAIDNATIGQRRYRDIVIELKTTITLGLYSPPRQIPGFDLLEGKTWKTLESWLATELMRADIAMAHRIDPHRNTSVMQLCRLAWIDKMIEDLNPKENQDAHHE